MSEEPDLARAAIVPLTADVVSSYLAGNRLGSAELPGLIASVHAAFERIQNPPPEAAEELNAPAVSVRKSLANRDKIVSMIDGKPYTSLRPHLAKNGLTPEQYRQRYRLPADYPMVAPGYSERRSLLAKALGLGRKAVTNVAEIVADAVVEAVKPVPEPQPVETTEADAGTAGDAPTDTPMALVETAALTKPRRGRPRKATGGDG